MLLKHIMPVQESTYKQIEKIEAEINDKEIQASFLLTKLRRVENELDELKRDKKSKEDELKSICVLKRKVSQNV